MIGDPGPLVGSIKLPGDKSISHRALILAAIAEGTSVIENCNVGLDVLATASVVAALGADCDRDGARMVVTGGGWDRLRPAAGPLQCHNSGSTLRLIAGVCAAIPGTHLLTGDESLTGRPMKRIADPLRLMGASVETLGSNSRPPVRIEGKGLQALSYDMEVASAQVKSSILLAGLAADGTTSVTGPAPCRDHTERMLTAAGVPVATTGTTASLTGPAQPSPCDRVIPGDVSAAAFLGVAASIIPGSDLSMTSLGLNPTRTAWIDALARMGARIESSSTGDEGGEPTGVLRVKASELTATTMGGDEIPNLIDEIPALAVAATQARGTTQITDASELRVKESDRIATLVTGLRSLGADIEERHDGMVIHGPTPLGDGRPDPRSDHRAAMAFAVAGLVSGSSVKIPGWACVDTSFPNFLEVVHRARRTPA